MGSKTKRQPAVRFSKDRKGKWYWWMQAANNRVVGVGTHRHDSLKQARAEFHRTAVGRGWFVYSTYKDSKGEWRWRQTHRRNNDIISASYDGYKSINAASRATCVPYSILRGWEAGTIRVVVAD